MNYSEPLVSQVIIFFRAVGAGIILGILYTAVSFMRMIFGERKSVYVTFDIIFSLAASVVSFFFMVLYNTGQVRLNLMVGELFGGVAFHLSLGRYILSSAEKYIIKTGKAVAFLLSPVKKIIFKASSKIKEKLKKHKTPDLQQKNSQKTEKNLSIFAKSP